MLAKTERFDTKLAELAEKAKTLKEVGLVKGTVDGPRVCYCLDYEALVRL